MEKQGKEQTTVRLPVELKKAIEKEADKYSVSLNERDCFKVCVK